MNHTLTLLTALLLAPLAVVTELRAAENAAGMPVVKTLDDCNVVWDSPSADSLGSMPLGNGDVGINLWVEPDGDLLFYISKVDAFNDSHTLPKLGRVRLKLTPNPFANGKPFRQELVLRDGAIAIKAGNAAEEVRLRVWVDANHPVIRVEGECATPLEAVVTQECWRGLLGVPSAEAADGHPKLPMARTAGIKLADTADRLVWAYRNITSPWKQKLSDLKQAQLAEKLEDPLLHLTSGCLIRGAGFVRATTESLRLAEKSRRIDFAVHVLACRTDTAAAWFARIEQQATQAATMDTEKAFAAHKTWWRAFWDRSYIAVEKCGDEPVRLDGYRFTQFKEPISDYCKSLVIDSRSNARQLTQRYALERFLQTAASRGSVPPPFNGSIFTMDLPVGSHKFGKPRTAPAGPDNRDWGFIPFVFWQNTRHPFWAMLARGDYDTMMPGFITVRDALEVSRDRCRQWFGHDGAFMTEGIYLKGAAVNVGLGGHLKYHYLGTIEMTAMMCDYFQHTQDRAFLEAFLLPCADEFIKFYELHFPKRDARGKMVMEPAGVAETYQPVTNPVTEVSGLRYLVGKLAAFDESLIGRQRKQHWSRFLQELPDVPWRTVKGLKLLAPGEKYTGRLICETPELYAVWPFRHASLGSDAEALARARQSFHVRQLSLDGTPDKESWETGGWQSAPIWAACLGLPREAARLTSINFDDRFPNIAGNADMVPPVPGHPRARFPAFWETKMDYTPDNDHGAVSANALQSLLLQSDGRKIYLLPAWPEDWDVSFKLHAAMGTTVECVYRDGKVQTLVVTPASRRADLVDCSSFENRIRTLVSVACADRNYLFGLPPMLDGLPTPGKTTGPWLEKYGQCVTGVRAAPWPGSVFTGNTLYVFSMGESEPKLPPVPATVVSSKLLAGQGESPVSILKVIYDRRLEPFALAAASKGSLTTGKISSGGELDLGRPATFDRIELTIENPDHHRGDGKKFIFDAVQDDGTWKTICQGAVYGNIFSKRFDPVTARKVRLVVDPPLRQFDLFPPEKEGE